MNPDIGLARHEYAKEDFNSTIELCAPLAGQGDREAIYLLARALRDRTPGAKGLAEARPWFERAAELGEPVARVIWARDYCLAAGGECADPQRAITWLRDAAESNEPSAWVTLGWAYENGRGMDWDLDSAKRYYRKAAEAGKPRAQYRLGRLLTEAQGEERKEALRWLLVAADQGFGEAIQWRDGEGVEWIEREAREGDAEACFQLAKRHLRAPESKANADTINEYLRRASNAGHVVATLYLAACYANGQLGRVDSAAAGALMEKAVELSA